MKIPARVCGRRRTLAAFTLFLACIFWPHYQLAAQDNWIGRPAPAWENTFQVWISRPELRVYSNSFGRDRTARDVELEGFRNEDVLAQLGVRSPEPVKALAVRASDLVSTEGHRISANQIRIRFPGLMPVDESGQYTPDPLWQAASVPLNAYQSQGVWIDAKIPQNTAPGEYKGTLDVIRDGARAATFHVTLKVLPATLPDPSGYHCYLNILFDPSSVARFNHLPLYGEEHWKQLQNYVEDLASHGQKSITAFIVDDPWNMDTGFPVRNMIWWKFPGKWTAAHASEMTFDFEPFDRFVTMCLKAGITGQIQCWSPLVQPHTDYSIVTYTDTTDGERRKLNLPAGSADYQAVWGRFASAFQEHLRAKGWLNKTYLGFDEIKTDVLDRVMPFFHQTAPDLKFMVSGGDEKGHYSAESRETAFHYGYYSPGSGIELPNIPERRREGRRTLLYTAVTPLYPNTFIFSEPLESRYLGWIIWKWGFDGYIRWAWDFWPATLWDEPQYKWHSGDMFFVYPGKDGPVDSIRWEMLLKGIQDYECLWQAKQGLEKARASGSNAELVAQGEKTLDHAVDLATQQFDRTKTPRDPIPANMDEARKLVNRLIVELAQRGLLAQSAN